MPSVPKRDVIPGLGEAIEARRRELRMSPGDLQRATGLSSAALANIRKGLRRDYAESLKFAICDALGWTTDSIDRLLAGHDPEERAQPQVMRGSAADLAVGTVDGDARTLSQLDDRVAALEQQVGRLVDQVQGLLQDADDETDSTLDANDAAQ